MWPLAGRPRLGGFPDPKKDEDYRNEEEDHLLEAVIDSDDEQADTLSPDQIRRYLDESRTKADPSQSGTSGSNDALVERLGRGRASSNEAHCSSNSRSTSRTRKRASAAPLVDECDELFDEEFEDEPDNVVVGAKLRPQNGVVTRDVPVMAQQVAGYPPRSPHDSWIAAVDQDFVPPSLNGIDTAPWGVSQESTGSAPPVQALVVEAQQLELSVSKTWSPESMWCAPDLLGAAAWDDADDEEDAVALAAPCGLLLPFAGSGFGGPMENRGVNGWMPERRGPLESQVEPKHCTSEGTGQTLSK